MADKLRVIITGASGMVGEGVLRVCLQHDAVERVLVVGRRPCGVQHPKLEEVLHPDFFDLTPIADRLQGYNACFFCLGVSSVGMKAGDYYRYTYTLTLHFAETVSRQNPDMVFIYVSGAGTDSTEKGRSRWARVKGKTEHDLMQLPFRAVYNFRPGYIHPLPGAQHTHGLYKALGWLYPLLRRVFPRHVSTMQELALAQIRAARDGYPRHVLEVKDIIALAGGNA